MYCSFCRYDIKLGRGKTVADKTGESVHFCSRACEHFFRVGKKAAKVKWTKKLIAPKKADKTQPAVKK